MQITQCRIARFILFLTFGASAGIPTNTSLCTSRCIALSTASKRSVVMFYPFHCLVLPSFWVHTFVRIMRIMQFDFDPQKAALNLAKHKVSFDEACTALLDARA